MSNPRLGNDAAVPEQRESALEELLERFAVDIMSTQRLMDKEVAIERDRYALALQDCAAELAPLLREVLPTRPLLARTTVEFSVTTGVSKSIGGGLKARLLNQIEVAGYESSQRTSTTFGTRITAELVQTAPSGQLQKE
jgi:hypothetical protein